MITVFGLTTHLHLTKGVAETGEEAVGTDAHGRLDVAVDHNTSFSNVSSSWKEGVDHSSTACLNVGNSDSY